MDNTVKNQRSVNWKYQKELNEKREILLKQMNEINQEDSKAQSILEQRVLANLFYANQIDLSVLSEEHLSETDFSDIVNSALYETFIKKIRSFEYDQEQIPIEQIDQAFREYHPELIEQYQEYGSKNYLVQISRLVNNVRSLKQDAIELRNYSQKRQLILSSIDFALSVNANDPDSFRRSYDNFSKKYQDTTDFDEKNKIQPMSKIAKDWVGKLTQNYTTGGVIDDGSLKFDEYEELNQILFGLKPGNMVTVGGRPGMGKTAFALNIIKQIKANQAKKNKKCVGAFFSLEMNSDEVMDRYMSMLSQLPAQLFKDANKLTSEDIRSLIYLSRSDKIDGLYIDEDPSVSVAEIYNKILEVQQKEGQIDFVVIDYLQLISSEKFSNDRQLEVSRNSREIKKIAKKLGIPIITLVQLSRALESRNDKRPMLSDIRESGAIEQDSDVVMFLYRDDYYETKTDKPETELVDSKGQDDGLSKMEVIVAKNRQGKRGTVSFIFDKTRSTFIESAIAGDSR